VTLNPNWGKGYARKGAALHGAQKWQEAIDAYEAGLKVEDSPALKKGLQDVKDAKAQAGMSRDLAKVSFKFTDIEAEVEEEDVTGIGKMFKDPNMWGKLAANPKTAKLMQDPQFVAQVCASYAASWILD
jgi:stress-induced-phosphoprotein 1